MTDEPPTDGVSDGVSDDEAHLAALLAVLTLVRGDQAPTGTPLQQWRARRIAALRLTTSDTQGPPPRPLLLP